MLQVNLKQVTAGEFRSQSGDQHRTFSIPSVSEVRCGLVVVDIKAQSHVTFI